MSQVAKVKFVNYRTSITRSLDLIGAGSVLPKKGLIIIKPNLTNSSPPPVTTSVAATEAVYQYCKAHTEAKIAIGEGCGTGTTPEVFAALGYTDMAKKYGLELIDFNEAETTICQNNNALQLKLFHMPRAAQQAFIISLPVLKDHSFTKTTIAMKNMFGIAPGKFYAGSWNKAKLHSPSTDKSVVDICSYKKPDLSIVDASVALKGMHLAGKHKNIGLILAGFDPVAVDTVGSELLGHNPKKLPFLTLADDLLGTMDDIEILEG
ncbi:MAG TPA: hypothetical protein DIU00_22905 [Phycisphaerales bacterium]|mgnify:CR=1 FL=1|nr:hypothetical protein [Phycisphaerales bacterium]